MNLRRDDHKRIALAPAKLNLFLELLGRRDDGFHELETLMVPIRLVDTLSFLPLSPGDGQAAPIVLDVHACRSTGTQAKAIPTGPRNLVVRALELLRQRAGCEQGARVELVKRVPAEAGLGGGSSDAATALRLANRGWGLNWSQERLADVAAEIGSDVPFFLGSGAAICRGRGERVERLPAIRPMHFVVIKPPEGLSTGEVYGAHAAAAEPSPSTSVVQGRMKELVSQLVDRRSCDIGQWMQNRLQKAASSLSTWVDTIRMVFDELGFLGHQLSGSGSAYFGVCRHAQHARRLSAILRTRQLGLVYATRSCQ